MLNAPSSWLLLVSVCLCVSATPLIAGPPVAPSTYQTPWARHTITATSQGADGVDLRDINGDGLRDVTTGWEEGGVVTVSLHPSASADPRSPWPTTVIASGLRGIEDAKFADLDGDGEVDVISANDIGARLYAHFSGPTWTTITLTSSLGHNRWMQVASADMDGDGYLDIIAGSRVGTAANPAVIAWFKNPGPNLARDGTAWPYHEMSKAGWTMSVITHDVDGDGDPDTIVSDRAGYRQTNNTVSWSLYGARWIETVRTESAAPSFINHSISIAGNCVACTPGDEMFATLHDFDRDGVLDLIDGTSSSNRPNRVVIHRNLGAWGPPATWSNDRVPAPINAGHYQAVAIGDIDRDGLDDLVVSTWEANQLPPSPLTGVYWQRNLGDGRWEQEELSGPAGTKYDNALLDDIDGDGDLDVLSSEQVENQGVIWFENPGFRDPSR